MGNEQNHERRKAANGAERRRKSRELQRNNSFLSVFCTRFQELITFSKTLARPKGVKETNKKNGTIKLDPILELIHKIIFFTFKTDSNLVSFLAF